MTTNDPPQPSVWSELWSFRIVRRFFYLLVFASLYGLFSKPYTPPNDGEIPPLFLTVTPAATATPTAVPTLPPSSVTACTCDSDRYNCYDFPTQDAAQTCYDECMDRGFGDVHILDIKRDGNVCTWLPHRP